MRNSCSHFTDAHKRSAKRESSPPHYEPTADKPTFRSEAAAAAAALANPTSLVVKPRPLTMRESQLVDHLVRLQLVSLPRLCLKSQFVDLFGLFVVSCDCAGVVAAIRNDPQRNRTSPPPSSRFSPHPHPFSRIVGNVPDAEPMGNIPGQPIIRRNLIRLVPAPGVESVLVAEWGTCDVCVLEWVVSDHGHGYR